MLPFDQAFPGFVQACADIYTSLLPWGMALLVIAFITEFWQQPPSAFELLRFLVKLFLVVLLLAKSHDLINDAQSLVHNWVEQKVPARPENVAQRYQEMLAAAQNAPEKADQSFWRTLFSSNWFEAIIYALLTLVAYLAIAVQFMVFVLQQAVLLLCWASSALLFPLLAIRPVSWLGLQHLLRIIGVILWPLGLALAATITDGFLDIATDPNFLGPSVAGSLGRGLMTLLAVGVIAVWIITSTILGPVMIMRLLTGSGGPGQVVAQAGGLLAQGGGAALAEAPAAGRGALRGARNAWTKAAEFFRGGRTTHSDAAGDMPSVRSHPPLSQTQPPPASAGWQPKPDDPTGDIQAREIVERTHKS